MNTMQFPNGVTRESAYPFARLLQDLEYRLEKADFGEGNREFVGRSRLTLIAIAHHEEFYDISWKTNNFLGLMSTYIDYIENSHFSSVPLKDIPLGDLEPRHIMAAALGGTWRFKDHDGGPGHSAWERV